MALLNIGDKSIIFANITAEAKLILFQTNKNGVTQLIGLLLLTLLMAASCKPARYVPEDRALLDRSDVAIESEHVGRRDLQPFIRQQPNRQIFGARFHLWLYNISNPDKSRFPHNWLRRVGEEPVVFDPGESARSGTHMRSYLHSKGFFDAAVNDSAIIDNKRARVYYNVELNDPYTVRSYSFRIEDSTLKSLILFDAVNSLIKPGDPFDTDLIQNEQRRIERYIRDYGYYTFVSEYILFFSDTTAGTRQVDIVCEVRNPQPSERNNHTGLHLQHRLRNIYVYPEFNPGEALTMGRDYFLDMDTTLYNGLYFIDDGMRPRVKYGRISRSMFVSPGQLFSVTSDERTRRSLSSLRTYRLINLNYSDYGPSGNDSLTRYIDVTLQLTPLDRHSFTFRLEGTNSAGNLGAAINLIYLNRNLLRGAQQFSLRFKGAYETLPEEVTGFSNMQELGVEAGLRLPDFLFPFLSSEAIIQRYDPKTNIQMAYNYQKIPVYTRTVFNTSFGYNWRRGNYSSHQLLPLQVNLVRLPFIDPDFSMRIDTSSYLSYSYRDVLIAGGSYSYIYSTRQARRSRGHAYMRITFEAAGNMLKAGSVISGATRGEDGYTIFGQQYAQYVRGDIDLRYTRSINNGSSFASRFFAGAGLPYGNSRALPFEKQYFGGGANSIRAWQVRSLGPGSFDNFVPSFINQTAEIKLEMNTEYRFDLFWILEGALFIDAGNIWTIKEDPDRPGARFRFNKFLDDMAIGSGAGLRVDIQFVLLRADLGIKLRDPSIQQGSKWIRANRPYNFRDDFTFTLGIGYPF